ncbi:hypothetical protein C3Y98_01975 [Methylotenera oryzisoli]|uniref:Uncharacterized protein n=1 Tax=Methylotenera oryzisoli TaxID=2080758 RepID=A0A4Y9VUF7_9PROT|nr:hypothetical protein [Methylotenera oryzisoli]TFW73140.1 hypothetical protein C3Y98_01975 [Methylotenera oryzisoli]
MTSINNVSSTNSVYQTSQVSSGTTDARFKPEDESRHGKDGGGLLGAIDSALKAAGISGGLSSILKDADSTNTSTSDTESSSDTTSTTDASSALSEFMANLMAALQSQNGTGVDSSAEAGNMPPPPPMGMGMGDIESKLQSLIAQLSNTSSTSTDSTDAENDALSASFSELMSALGKQSSTSSDLESFLQALSSKLSGQGPSGNVINTTA